MSDREERELMHRYHKTEIDLTYTKDASSIFAQAGPAVRALFRGEKTPRLDAFADDELWPRNEENRYRLYAVRSTGPKRWEHELEVLAACPNPGGIGCAIVALHEDAKKDGRRLADLGRIGVLDVMPDGRPSPSGEWVVLPFDRSFE